MVLDQYLKNIRAKFKNSEKISFTYNSLLV